MINQTFALFFSTLPGKWVSTYLYHFIVYFNFLLQIDKTLFEKSLLRKDREDFVSLFLDQGFQIHKYLNHKNLKYLFEKAEDSEFFQTVCLQGILGKTHMVSGE